MDAIRVSAHPLHKFYFAAGPPPLSLRPAQAVLRPPFLSLRHRQRRWVVQPPYILDLNAELTQVLFDGTTAYIFGLDLVSHQTGINEEYPLRDALGSIRQVTDPGSILFVSIIF